MKYAFKSHWFFRTTLLVLLAGLALQGCGGGSSTPNADPTGYYDVTGTATVKADDNTTDLPISDLQGMVNGNRFTAMSAAEGLVYDGTLTIVNVDTFTANISIYRDGSLLTTATASGTITQGSSITGTLTGTGAGNGTFRLTYALSNNQAAALSRVQSNVDEMWFSVIGGSLNFGFGFVVAGTGEITHRQTADSGVFNGCVVASGTMTPVSNTNVYQATFTLSSCSNNTVDGTYTGLASTRAQSVADDRLVLVASKTAFCIHGEFTRESTI